ncbi:hypothetical protein, partial [Enterococcus faecalis]|uniref:hypothetical protein n=1 Tax=Enterococcus faecalis TaxID=1351 RepID=UPI001EE8E549
INGNTSLRYLEFREGAFDFQTLQQNPVTTHPANFPEVFILSDPSRPAGRVLIVSVFVFTIIVLLISVIVIGFSFSST